MHADQTEARKWLERKLGDVLLPLAKRVVETGKYSDAVNILAESTETLRKIIQIQDDMKMEAGDVL